MHAQALFAWLDRLSVAEMLGITVAIFFATVLVAFLLEQAKARAVRRKRARLALDRSGSAGGVLRQMRVRKFGDRHSHDANSVAVDARPGEDLAEYAEYGARDIGR